MLATQLIPGLPEMVEGALVHFPGQEREVNNMSSGIFNSFLGIGQVIAPLYGSTANALLGFKHTTTISGAFDISFAILYFAFAGGATAFITTYKNFTEPDKILSPILSQRDKREVFSPFLALSPSPNRRNRTISRTNSSGKKLEYLSS